MYTHHNLLIDIGLSIIREQGFRQAVNRHIKDTYAIENHVLSALHWRKGWLSIEGDERSGQSAGVNRSMCTIDGDTLVGND